MRAPELAGAGSGAPPQRSEDDRPLTAFDFDGTLTTRDSFSLFLRWRTNARALAVGLLRLAPELTLYPVRRDRGRLKCASVRVFLRGVAREALELEAEAFAAEWATRLFRPDALAAWEAHRAAGDRLVVVTASPEEVVAPFARRLGADDLIGSRLRWTRDERVGDGLDGPNCRGPEKVRRLQDRFGPSPVVVDAYGDTSGDREMLAVAKRGHMRLFKGEPG
jgi:phosphatidylglycerophosphatase C